MPCYGQWWLGRQCWHLCFRGYHEDSRGLLLSWELRINHWELWPRSQCANRQSTWRFLKTKQIMEEQENQLASENKALWSTGPLYVTQQCRAVASLSHPNEKKLEEAHHRWQRSILGISWKDKVTNEKVREATALPKLEDIIRCRRLRWLGHLSRIDHHWLPRQALIWEPEGFRTRPGRPRQNWKDVVEKDLRKMGISWDEVEEAAEYRRSSRNRVAQCVFDAGWTRNQDAFVGGGGPCPPAGPQPHWEQITGGQSGGLCISGSLPVIFVFFYITCSFVANKLTLCLVNAHTVSKKVECQQFSFYCNFKTY